MGRLLDGKWVTGDIGTDSKGRYVRRETQFRNMVTASGESGFKAEAGRYRLIVSYACGWSHRTLLVRALKGLEDAVSVTYVDPVMGENGWTLEENEKEGLTSKDLLYHHQQDDDDDNNNNNRKDIPAIHKLYELYILAQSDYTGRVSVPVLWDTKKATIVSNESSEIIKMFDGEFNAFSSSSSFKDSGSSYDDLALLEPDGMEESMDAMNQANYGSISNGVYKCGFAASQEAYTEVAVALFARLDELEILLGKQRYLLPGGCLTMADLCLFPTIYRFDTVYYTHFKCNHKHIYVEYPNLFAWAREIYQTRAVRDTCSMDQICIHYYTSHESVHPRRFIPLGPDIPWDEPHGRGDRTYGGAK